MSLTPLTKRTTTRRGHPRKGTRPAQHPLAFAARIEVRGVLDTLHGGHVRQRVPTSCDYVTQSPMVSELPRPCGDRNAAQARAGLVAPLIDGIRRWASA